VVKEVLRWYIKYGNRATVYYTRGTLGLSPVIQAVGLGLSQVPCFTPGGQSQVLFGLVQRITN